MNHFLKEANKYKGNLKICNDKVINCKKWWVSLRKRQWLETYRTPSHDEVFGYIMGLISKWERNPRYRFRCNGYLIEKVSFEEEIMILWATR